MNYFEKIILMIRNQITIDKNSKLEISKKCKIRNCEIKVRDEKTKKGNLIQISRNVKMNKTKIEIRGENCLISIGKNTIIGKNSYLSARENNIKIEIGSDCMLSRNIKIMTSDGHSIFNEKQRVNVAQNIKIGNNVWIADNVTILKGVTLADGVIVAINSTVTKSCTENNVILAGNPAKIVKRNVIWKDELIY